MYRWACSLGMAVQWLSHQTGLVALAGCSGGLEKEGRRERLKSPKKKRVGLRICVGRKIRGATDKREKQHSGRAKVKKERQGGMCGIKREYLGYVSIRILWATQTFAQGHVFHFAMNACFCDTSRLLTYLCTQVGNHSKWGWADMCEKWSPVVSSPFYSWRTQCCWSVTGHTWVCEEHTHTKQFLHVKVAVSFDQIYCILVL